MASEYEEKYTEQEWISVLQDRLAAYEETGLTPEQCENAKAIIESAFKDPAADVCQEHMDRILAEIIRDRMTLIPFPDRYPNAKKIKYGR